MQKPHAIFIAGAGGIGQAVGLILRELWNEPVELYLGDIHQAAIDASIDFITGKSSKKTAVHGVLMPKSGSNDALDSALKSCQVLLDCLPGSQAPRMAGLAMENGLHYANLTEYVAETNAILDLAKNAPTGFILQTGLAPGYIGVLAMDLFQDFCKDFGVEKVDRISMKVGALTRNANPPHYYGFTWSPIGVATEYVKPAVVVRGGEITERPSLSERETIVLNGITYEADLTSGGAADLPDALAGKVDSLDYKTIRYPGHYAWVDSLLAGIPKEKLPDGLEKVMLKEIPSVEDDLVILHALVEGVDSQGRRRLKESGNLIGRSEIGGRMLRAIQTTTAAPLAECARMLLSGKYKGIILQSQLDAKAFLSGPFVAKIYGKMQ